VKAGIFVSRTAETWGSWHPGGTPSRIALGNACHIYAQYRNFGLFNLDCVMCPDRGLK
jgi:hypothetical protein